MSTFYCRNCAATRGLFTVSIPVNLTGTRYQRDKFIKHTTPTGIYPLNSVFDDPSPRAYRSNILSASAAGFVEKDTMGRINAVYYPGERTGKTTGLGYLRIDSAVKVPLPHDPQKIHAFPTADFAFLTARCADCGRCLMG